jgi:hypothetical protein
MDPALPDPFRSLLRPAQAWLSSHVAHKQASIDQVCPKNFVRCTGEAVELRIKKWASAKYTTLARFKHVISEFQSGDFRRELYGVIHLEQ